MTRPKPVGGRSSAGASRGTAPPGQILYLSRSDVEAAAVPMTAIIERLEEAFREKGHGRVEMPPKPASTPGRPGTTTSSTPCRPSSAPSAPPV